MLLDDVHEDVEILIFQLYRERPDSEIAILEELAEAGHALSVDELAERTDYVERTIKRRTKSLEEKLDGEPIIARSDDGEMYLHPVLADGLRKWMAKAEAGRALDEPPRE